MTMHQKNQETVQTESPNQLNWMDGIVFDFLEQAHREGSGWSPEEKKQRIAQCVDGVFKEFESRRLRGIHAVSDSIISANKTIQKDVLPSNEEMNVPDPVARERLLENILEISKKNLPGFHPKN